MDPTPENPPSPKVQAEKFISDLKKAAALPAGKHPDLSLAEQISQQYREVPDEMLDRVFPTLTVQDLELTDHRYDIIDTCDRIVADSRPNPPDATPFAEPEHQQTAENIRLHHQLSDAIITKQNLLFLDQLPPDIETSIRRETIGSQQWISFTADLLQSTNLPIQVYHTTDTISPDNPTEIFFFRQGERTFMASYSSLKPDQPQVPEVMTVRIEDKNTQGEISTTEISSASSGRVTSVEINGQPQSPQDSKRIITAAIGQISDFQLSPPSDQEILAKTNRQELINDILKGLRT